jgi:hypothetical protein
MQTILIICVALAFSSTRSLPSFEFQMMVFLAITLVPKHRRARPAVLLMRGWRKRIEKAKPTQSASKSALSGIKEVKTRDKPVKSWN